MTNTVSHRCGFADTTNTGVPAGSVLYNVPQDIRSATPSTGRGWRWDPRHEAITARAHAVIKNVRVTGRVWLDGSGATLEDSDVVVGGDGDPAIQLRHAPRATIRDNNIHGPVQTPYPRYCGAGISDVYGDSEDITVERNDIWFCASAMQVIHDGGVIEQNYIHDYGFGGPADHSNGILLEPGSGEVTIVRNNTILNPLTQTDAVMVATDNPGTQSNRVIDHNLLGGGGYSFYGGGGGRPISNIIFTNNQFSRLHFPKGGRWGPAAYWEPGDGNVWRGNMWADTGAPVSP